MDLPATDGIHLLTFAFGKEDDDKLFARWIGFAQYEVSFEEFKRKLMPVKVNEKKTISDLDKLMETTTWSKIPIRSN